VPASEGEVCLVDLVAPTVARLSGAILPPALARDCAPEASAQAGRLVESQSLTAGAYARSARVVGVVPDGVGAVTIRSRRRPPLVVPVIRNAYDVVVSDPAAVTFVVRQRGRALERRVPLAIVQAHNPPAR
jgi:hypothetical protein